MGTMADMKIERELEAGERVRLLGRLRELFNDTPLLRGFSLRGDFGGYDGMSVHSVTAIPSRLGSESTVAMYAAQALKEIVSVLANMDFSPEEVFGSLYLMVPDIKEYLRVYPLAEATIDTQQKCVEGTELEPICGLVVLIFTFPRDRDVDATQKEFNKYYFSSSRSEWKKEEGGSEV